MSRHGGDKPLTKKQQKAVADKARAAQNERKEAQRLRDAAMGIARVEVRFAARTLDMVRFGCQVRGGLQEPYGLNEYLDTLVRQDYERLKLQVQALEGQVCEQCHKPLPQGCAGQHPGYATCWFKRSALSLVL